MTTPTEPPAAGGEEPTSPARRRRTADERRGPSFVMPPPPGADGGPAGRPIEWASPTGGGAGPLPPPPPPSWQQGTGRPAASPPPAEPEAPRNKPYQYVVLAAIGALFLYYLIRGGSLERDQLVFFGVLIPSIILHEVSHGAVALLFGDDTAKRAGRLTLNPLKHIDPFWTIILPAMMVIYTGTAFGMAKPVPVNPGRMRSPRNHGMFTALAGPATNIVIAAFAWAWYRLAYGDENPFLLFGGVGEPPLLADVLLNLGLANCVLAAFNLIPIPPLDGSSVFERILPEPLLEPYLRLRQFSFFLFIGLYLLGADAFGRILNPVVELWFRLLFT